MISVAAINMYVRLMNTKVSDLCEMQRTQFVFLYLVLKHKVDRVAYASYIHQLVYRVYTGSFMRRRVRATFAMERLSVR